MTWKVRAVERNRADKVPHTKAAEPTPVITPNAEARCPSLTLSAWNSTIHYYNLQTNTKSLTITKSLHTSKQGM